MSGSKEQPTKFAAVDLTRAKIEGHLQLLDATVKDALTMAELEVGEEFVHRR